MTQVKSQGRERQGVHDLLSGRAFLAAPEGDDRTGRDDRVERQSQVG
jgi:hypothetical protein